MQYVAVKQNQQLILLSIQRLVRTYTLPVPKSLCALVSLLQGSSWWGFVYRVAEPASSPAPRWIWSSMLNMLVVLDYSV